MMMVVQLSQSIRILWSSKVSRCHHLRLRNPRSYQRRTCIACLLILRDAPLQRGRSQLLEGQVTRNHWLEIQTNSRVSVIAQPKRQHNTKAMRRCQQLPQDTWRRITILQPIMIFLGVEHLRVWPKQGHKIDFRTPSCRTTWVEQASKTQARRRH